MSASTSTVATMQQANSSVDEWETRVQLAACYRIFDMVGWTGMIFNHISLRVPGPDRHFLINPFGLWYREVTASNLVKIDIEGNPVDSSQWPINRAGFVLHSAIHAGARGYALHHAYARHRGHGNCLPTRWALPGQLLLGADPGSDHLSRF
jgi:hypothetical protein